MVAFAYLYTLSALCLLRPIVASSDDTGTDAPVTSNDTIGDGSPHVKDILVSSEDTDGAAAKKEQAEQGVKLDEAAKETAASKELLERIEKEQKRIHNRIGENNLKRVQELLQKKKELLKKIASIGKTLRVEHDARFPHLVGKPIVIIAKDENDTKRAANTLAHLEGLNDVINHIQSPCSSLERIRATEADLNRKSKKDKFAVIQKTLDSMSAEERLNYDRKMIEHYEGIIREIESGIAKADEELAMAWKSYTQ